MKESDQELNRWSSRHYMKKTDCLHGDSLFFNSEEHFRTLRSKNSFSSSLCLNTVRLTFLDGSFSYPSIEEQIQPYSIIAAFKDVDVHNFYFKKKQMNEY